MATEDEPRAKGFCQTKLKLKSFSGPRLVQWMCSLASKMSIFFFLHCRKDTHSDSSLLQQDENTDYSTEKVEIPHTASFVDPYDPALFVGKRPLSDPEKIHFTFDFQV